MRNWPANILMFSAIYAMIKWGIMQAPLGDMLIVAFMLMTAGAIGMLKDDTKKQ